jgi:hypothetical protein
MKKYTGVVIATYQMKVEIEADSKAAAEAKMVEHFLSHVHSHYSDLHVEIEALKEGEPE